MASVLFALGATAFAQLERAFEAHGGLVKWKRYGSVEFDLTWTSAKGTKKDHQLFDLRSREGLITSERYILGASKGEVWIKPNPAALGGTPPRFYMWTPFYFFGMPFVFGDPGAIQESLGKKTKAQSGSTTTAGNFREDVNTSGSINAGDVALVKSKAGTVLPP